MKFSANSYFLFFLLISFSSNVFCQFIITDEKGNTVKGNILIGKVGHPKIYYYRHDEGDTPIKFVTPDDVEQTREVELDYGTYSGGVTLMVLSNKKPVIHSDRIQTISFSHNDLKSELIWRNFSEDEDQEDVDQLGIIFFDKDSIFNLPSPKLRSKAIIKMKPEAYVRLQKKALPIYLKFTVTDNINMSDTASIPIELTPWVPSFENKDIVIDEGNTIDYSLNLRNPIAEIENQLNVVLETPGTEILKTSYLLQEKIEIIFDSRWRLKTKTHDKLPYSMVDATMRNEFTYKIFLKDVLVNEDRIDFTLNKKYSIDSVNKFADLIKELNKKKDSLDLWKTMIERIRLARQVEFTAIGAIPGFIASFQKDPGPWPGISLVASVAGAFGGGAWKMPLTDKIQKWSKKIDSLKDTTKPTDLKPIKEFLDNKSEFVEFYSQTKKYIEGIRRKRKKMHFFGKLHYGNVDEKLRRKTNSSPHK